MRQLAKIYQKGVGVESDPDLASQWYRRAAEAGDPQAQYDFGQRCLRDLTSTTPVSQATEWFERSAVQGHRRAQFALGICHATGKNMEKNLVEAFCWLSMALDGGLRKAERRLQAVENQMDADALREARRLVAKRKHANDALN